MVFLVYFKDKAQLDDAIALDGNTNQIWTIHGKCQDNSVMRPQREVLARALVSTVPDKKKQDSTIVTPAAVKEVTMEEVVDTVNKFRKNLLDEPQVETVSAPLKDYTSPVNVVKIIKEYREEILVEHEKTSINDAIMIDPTAADRMAKKTRVNDKKKNGAKSDLAEKVVKDAKNQSVSTKNSEKIVTPVELPEYNKVNADCTKRLEKKKSEYPFMLSNNNPFIILEEDELFLARFLSLADDEDVIKAIKKCMKKKQGTYSDVEYEESEDGLREVKIKKERKPWAGKPGSRMGQKKKKECYN
ncbi:hypothetical protein RhiirB3_393891 [Rhizophagus irregularis]|nr:hypothetical protein RhiirB3_393891 [Rhizophagus irregularis]